MIFFVKYGAKLRFETNISEHNSPTPDHNVPFPCSEANIPQLLQLVATHHRHWMSGMASRVRLKFMSHLPVHSDAATMLTSTWLLTAESEKKQRDPEVLTHFPLTALTQQGGVATPRTCHRSGDLHSSLPLNPSRWPPAWRPGCRDKPEPH